MAHVFVRLYAGMRKYLPNGEGQVDIQPGETVADVLNRLGIPANTARIIFIDHRIADLTSQLNGGEQLAVFPAVGGG